MATLEQQVLDYEVAKALARKSFLDFILWMNPDYRPEWYHRHIAHTLERWAHHEIPWLIITMPPRHGKTELVSRYLPAWIFGAVDPKAKFICSSGEQDLTDANSTDVRRIMADERYIELFGEKLAGRQRDELWDTADGGLYQGRSVGAGISGRGANNLIIDDYFGRQALADSPAERQRLWDWYNSDAKKRLQYPASVCVMATRWHHDDLIGRILNSPEASRFEVLHIPKVNDWREDEQPPWDPRAPGEPLLGPFSRGPDEFFPDEEIPPRWRDRAKIVTRAEVAERVLSDYELDRATNARTVAALDQGRPTPRGGSLFQTDWFKHYDQPPGNLHETADEVFISIDPAFKTGSRNDPSALVVAARVGPKIFVLDVVVRRMAFPALVAECERLMEAWPRAKLLIEDEAAGQSLIQILRARFSRVHAFSPRKYGNKAQRAEVAADYYAGSSIYHPRRAPWLEQFELELSQFPGATHDDQVDAISQLCCALNDRGRGAENIKKALRAIRGHRHRV